MKRNRKEIAISYISILLVVIVFFWSASRFSYEIYFKIVIFVIGAIVGGVFLFGVIKYLSLRKPIAENNRLLSILNHDCDPVRFIQEVTAYMNKPIKKEFFLKMAKSNLAVGYLANGDFDKSIEILESIPIDETKGHDVSTNVVLRFNLCTSILRQLNVRI